MVERSWGREREGAREERKEGRREKERGEANERAYTNPAYPASLSIKP